VRMVDHGMLRLSNQLFGRPSGHRFRGRIRKSRQAIGIETVNAFSGGLKDEPIRIIVLPGRFRKLDPLFRNTPARLRLAIDPLAREAVRRRWRGGRSQVGERNGGRGNRTVNQLRRPKSGIVKISCCAASLCAIEL
jgi:hypothetical protein